MYKRIPLDGQIRDLLSLISLANGKLAEEDLTMSQANLPIVGNEEGPSLLEELQEMKQSISTLAQKASTSEQSILILNQSNSVLEQKISVLDNSNSALSERIMHLHQEEMLGHVAELESFLPDNDPWSDDRVARNLAVHGGDFRKSEEALRYIEEHDVTRLKGAVEGFRRRYGISRTDYHDFQLATGPDEVIHALNKKSDVAHFTLLKRCNGSSRKAATEVCDSIISKWKTHNSSSSRENFPTEAIRNDVDRINHMIEEMIVQRIKELCESWASKGSRKQIATKVGLQ